MEGKWLLQDLNKLKSRKGAKGNTSRREGIVGRNADYLKLIERYKRMYDALEPYRRQRKRCYNFYLGKQWEDPVFDPSDPCRKKMITERELLMREGKAPLSNNLILKDVNFVLGLFRDGHKKPMVVATNSDNQDLSDMVSNAMYYVYNDNEGLNVDAYELQEMLVGGICVSGVRPNGRTADGIQKIQISNENPAMMFFDGDLTDMRMNGIKTIGFLRSYTKNELIANFAHSREERKYLEELFESRVTDTNANVNPFDENRYENEDFYIPFNRETFRVIEAWDEQEREMIRFHSKLEGKVYTATMEQKDKVDELSVALVERAMEDGEENPEDAALEIEYYTEKYWTVKYLTAWGDLLMESECPYKHGRPPYTVRAYRLVNGAIQSWVSNLIPQQKYINRYITMMDFQQGAAAKGVLLFPEELKPKNMSHKQILEAWSKTNSVIFTKGKVGAPEPKQFNTSAINNGEIQMLQMQQGLLEEISGVRGAATGATASQGTPSSLYAQESQNAIVNLRDVTDFFVAYLRARNLQVMQIFLQYQTNKVSLRTFGGDFSEEAMQYDPDKIKDVVFDLVPTESSINVPAYTMYQNDILKDLAVAGVIPAQIWLKRAGFPYSGSLQRDLEAFQQQQLAMQQQTIDAQMPRDGNIAEASEAPQSQPIGQDIVTRGKATPQELTKAVVGANMRDNNM